MLRNYRRTRARRYLEAQGLWSGFSSADPCALPPNAFDLAFLHRLVRRKRFRCILELGSGSSTVAIAHALARNFEEDAARGGADVCAGRLYSLEANSEWAANSRAKLPPELERFVEIRVSRPRAISYAGQLCHTYDDLPPIAPSLIFVDGPCLADVVCDDEVLRGAWSNGARKPMAADPLLYEHWLARGALIVVDGREANTDFLRRNLKRDFTFRRDVSPGLHCFSLT